MHSTAMQRQGLRIRYQNPASVRNAPGVARVGSSVAPVSSSAPSPARNAKEVVDEVLALVKDTDGGMNMAEEVRAKVDNLLDELEAAGKRQSPKPLKNELLWGNYNVVYTSTRRAPSERGSPSGGRFRSRVGRALFRTTGLFQSVLQPGIVTNKVAFKMLGLVDGAVGLRGAVKPVGDDDATVRVDFEPPVLQLGSLHFCIGRDSDVQLTTTYLDERVRVGKGSRGSLFMFTRGGASDEAGMDKVGRESTAPFAAFAVAAGFIALMLGGLALWMQPNLFARATAGLIWLVGAGIGAVIRSGGLIRHRSAPAAKPDAAASVPPAASTA